MLAAAIEGSFKRIQFTPDLLPSDLVGSMLYRSADGRFEFQRGPIFANFVLADEINRAPAKVQSALLEAMEERQVTSADKTYPRGLAILRHRHPESDRSNMKAPGICRRLSSTGS